MVTTFVIGLREGLEAALVVGIIAAFLVRRGERSALRALWWGVAAAVTISIGGALGLGAANRALTLRSRELMEGALALGAVGGVTYMVLWMRRHSATLRRDLEVRTGAALAGGSTVAVFALTFVAVLREGLETAVFLLATLEHGADPATGVLGAVAGIGVAAVLGFGIYRGGVAIDLRRFFLVTGLFLVVVAAGLAASAVHSFAEAGVIGVLQAPAVDLSRLIGSGSEWSSLLTALFGFQPVPTVAEVAAWAAFLVPMSLYMARSSTPRIRHRSVI